VSWRTISRFEAGESILPKRVQALRVAFEAAGVLFIERQEFSGALVGPEFGRVGGVDSAAK
jgi:hypothetical protein